MPAQALPRVGFITDTEGNFEYWTRCVELSEVVPAETDERREGRGVETATLAPC